MAELSRERDAVDEPIVRVQVVRVGDADKFADGRRYAVVAAERQRTVIDLDARDGNERIRLKAMGDVG